MIKDKTQARSSTPLFLNGDERLNPINKLRYYFYHYFRNKRENVIPFDPEIPWPTKRADYDPALANMVFDRTPSRILCNIFWSLVDWEAIRQELGPLVFHDIGCGSGRYGMLLREFAGFEIDYYGYDIVEHKRWTEYENARTRFFIYDGHSYESTFTGAPNIFVSQSALEHIPHDMDYFKAVSNYARNKERIVQIHMIPGATGLRQWGPHGWRQYNRDMLCRIKESLSDGMEMTVYCLGGREIVDLHVKWVHNRRRHKTIKRDPSKREIYRAEWLRALDSSPPKGADDASFLTLVIEKGLSAPLWPRLLRTSANESIK